MNDMNSDLALMVELQHQDMLIKQVRDDMGRLSGDHPSGSFDDGGAGYSPMSTPDAAACMNEAGIPCTYTGTAMGREVPAHLTSMPHAEVHKKLLAVGHRHQARAGYAPGDADANEVPVTAAMNKTEQNVYDRGDQRMVTEHQGQQGGTAVRGYQKAKP